VKLLAIDTSSLACSAAVVVDGQVCERHEEQAREHTRLLLPMIQAVLAEGGLVPAELDAVVLGNGPGSFIGMRIAASVAQGIAHGAGLDIVPVSSLAAVAAQVFAEADVAEVVVAQDAHLSEVYLGAYRRGAGDELVEIFPERLQTQTLIEELTPDLAPRRAAAGSGWDRYPALAAANATLIGQRSRIQHPRARYLLTLGERALERGAAIRPRDLAPAYLRSKVAQKPATEGV
jgi:tRNA threonylcarbamoyladenosine biosynthesis protein TsaB